MGLWARALGMWAKRPCDFVAVPCSSMFSSIIINIMASVATQQAPGKELGFRAYYY
jgi:hypothetical protein